MWIRMQESGIFIMRPLEMTEVEDHALRGKAILVTSEAALVTSLRSRHGVAQQS